MQPLLAAFNSHWEPLFWFALGVCGAVGIVAVLHPRRIAPNDLPTADAA